MPGSKGSDYKAIYLRKAFLSREGLAELATATVECLEGESPAIVHVALGYPF